MGKQERNYIIVEEIQLKCPMQLEKKKKKKGKTNIED